MAIKIYIGKQAKEKEKATRLVDAGATDYNVEDNITTMKSEVFQDLQAEGDSDVSKIEVSGNVPIEFTPITLEELLPGISYKKTGQKYKMDKGLPAFYTIVMVDNDRDEKWEYIDCVISNLSMNLALGAYITGGIDVIGKKYDVGTGDVTGAIDRGKSLRALFSSVSLSGTDISADIEGMDIAINNGMEAKGSLNSLYNEKLRRNQPQGTTVTIQKNEYEKGSYAELKEKMIKGDDVTAKLILGTPKDKNLITIDFPKMFVNSNKRGDWKGSGSHDVELAASVTNKENSHMVISIKAESGTTPTPSGD